MSERSTSHARPDGELARERIYAQVKHQILAGDLPPGAALSENLLAAEFGVSRTPAREALHRLAMENLVHAVPKRGTFVSPLPSVSYVRQLYELREAIAGMSARLAAKRATGSEVEELFKLIEAMGSSGGIEDRGALADRFITYIDELSGNELLASVNRNLLDQLHRLRHRVMRGDESYYSAALDRRKRLAAAIEQREGDKAEQLAREIVQHVKDDAIRLLTQE